MSNPQRAEQIAKTLGQHAPTQVSAPPTGSDRKSQEIAEAFRAVQQMNTEAVQKCNRNLDAVRAELAAAARRAAAQQNANSGEEE